MKRELKDCELHAIFVADHGWISKIIGGQGRGFWSHMALRVGHDTVIDARASAIPIPQSDAGQAWARAHGYKQHEYIAPGVQSRPLSYLDKNSDYLELVIPCTHSQITGVYSDLKHQEGKPYDKLGIIAFGDDSIYDRNWRDQSAWFCDELAMYAIERRGLCKPILQPVYRMTPGFACGICMMIDGARVVRWRGNYVERNMEHAFEAQRCE